MEKVTSRTLQKFKKDKKKIISITAYDFTLAKLFDDLVDVILVGDSLGMVIQGELNTLSVTMDEMVYHSRSVSKAIQNAHLVCDLPFMSYQSSSESALKNAGRLLSQGRAEAVKLEGGAHVADTVLKLVQAGIPVMGHVGLTPQSVHQFGGYKVQGKTEDRRNSIIQDAIALEEAGAYSVVLEGMPVALSKEITERLSIPTIGIGAGPDCDGQILVCHDLLGLNPQFKPRFVKQYATLSESIREAVMKYSSEVQNGIFPDMEHSFQL